MSDLTPSQAAEIALGVYALRKESDFATMQTLGVAGQRRHVAKQRANVFGQGAVDDRESARLDRQ